MNIFESFETESDSCLNNYQEKYKTQKEEEDSSLTISNISNENIYRCWFFFTYSKLLEKIAPNILINYKFDKGNNIFKIGNEFSCYMIGVSKIRYKCIESENNYFIRKISWIISLDIGISVKKTYILYPITFDNRTLIKLNLEIIQNDDNEQIEFEETRDYYYNLQYSIINKIIKSMNESNKNNFIHESFISNIDFENCWKIITNFNILSNLISNDIGCNFICNGDKEKIGNFWKCNLQNYNQVVYFRIKNIRKNKKRNKWVYFLETIGTYLKVVSQQIEISVTKINKDSNQISIVIIFNDNINRNFYEYQKLKFNDIMKKIKKFMNKI